MLTSYLCSQRPRPAAGALATVSKSQPAGGSEGGALTDLLRLPIIAVAVSVARTRPAVLRGWWGAARMTPWCSVLGTRCAAWEPAAAHWTPGTRGACGAWHAQRCLLTAQRPWGNGTHLPHHPPLPPQGSTLRKRKMYEEFLSKVSILGQSECGDAGQAGGTHAAATHTPTHACGHSRACMHRHTAVSQPHAVLGLGRVRWSTGPGPPVPAPEGRLGGAPSPAGPLHPQVW